jgi:hypothetical protein
MSRGRGRRDRSLAQATQEEFRFTVAGELAHACQRDGDQSLTRPTGDGRWNRPSHVAVSEVNSALVALSWKPVEALAVEN